MHILTSFFFGDHFCTPPDGSAHDFLTFFPSTSFGGFSRRGSTTKTQRTQPRRQSSPGFHNQRPMNQPGHRSTSPAYNPQSVGGQNYQNSRHYNRAGTGPPGGPYQGVNQQNSRQYPGPSNYNNMSRNGNYNSGQNSGHYRTGSRAPHGPRPEAYQGGNQQNSRQYPGPSNYNNMSMNANYNNGQNSGHYGTGSRAPHEYHDSRHHDSRNRDSEYFLLMPNRSSEAPW